MSKHTPGPWRAVPVPADETYFLDVNIVREDGLAVAAAVHNGNIEPETVLANALVIAAAPDMLAALKVAKANLEHMAAWITAQNRGYSFECLGEDMPGIDAAIAKAEGRP